MWAHGSRIDPNSCHHLTHSSSLTIFQPQASSILTVILTLEAASLHVLTLFSPSWWYASLCQRKLYTSPIPFPMSHWLIPYRSLPTVNGTLLILHICLYLGWPLPKELSACFEGGCGQHECAECPVQWLSCTSQQLAWCLGEIQCLLNWNVLQIKQLDSERGRDDVGLGKFNVITFL